MVTRVLLETTPVVTGKLAEVLPDGTVTVAGTEAAAAFELRSATVMPPAPAAALSVTVPVAEAPCAATAGSSNERNCSSGRSSARHGARGEGGTSQRHNRRRRVDA